MFSDIDECASSNGGCQCSSNAGGCGVTCANLPGSFRCNCFSGFSLESDGTTCIGTFYVLLAEGYYIQFLGPQCVNVRIYITEDASNRTYSQCGVHDIVQHVHVYTNCAVDVCGCGFVSGSQTRTSVPPTMEAAWVPVRTWRAASCVAVRQASG